MTFPMQMMAGVSAPAENTVQVTVGVAEDPGVSELRGWNLPAMVGSGTPTAVFGEELGGPNTVSILRVIGPELYFMGIGFIDDTLPQTFFTSVAVEGVGTFETASADSFSNTGGTQWGWVVPDFGDWVDTAVRDVVFTQ